MFPRLYQKGGSENTPGSFELGASQVGLIVTKKLILCLKFTSNCMITSKDACNRLELVNTGLHKSPSLQWKFTNFGVGGLRGVIGVEQEFPYRIEVWALQVVAKVVSIIMAPEDTWQNLIIVVGKPLRSGPSIGPPFENLNSHTKRTFFQGTRAPRKNDSPGEVKVKGLEQRDKSFLNSIL